MKQSVIKVLFTFVCFTIISPVLKAECSSSERVQLNTQASYVTYDYTYNDETELFDIHFYNLTSYLYLEYNSNIYYPKKEETIIKNVENGKRMTITVNASTNTNCEETQLRSITYQVPYKNAYLDSVGCGLYPELSICNTKFLSYKLTDEMFNRIFDTQKVEYIGTEAEEPVVEETWVDVLKNYALKYGMQVGLSLIGTVSILILGRKAVKRAKAKF
jgi:hypothetical protein